MARQNDDAAEMLRGRARHVLRRYGGAPPLTGPKDNTAYKSVCVAPSSSECVLCSAPPRPSEDDGLLTGPDQELRCPIGGMDRGGANLSPA